MSLAIPKTLKQFAETQGKEEILRAVGDLDSVKVTQNDVLVATYIRPERTSGGLYLPDSAIEEDLYQGKVGLVLKMGPVAFIDQDEPYRFDVKPQIHDWVVYRVGDAWDVTLRQVHCRLIADSNIRLIINDPEEIF